jgi:hypothetical protein
VTTGEIGALQRLDPRDVFASEAQDFTPWLADNLGLLGESLGLEIELVQREMPVGRYSVDIYAKDIGTDRAIVIENQLEPTDHAHLGQLLTYAAGLESKIVVWISPEFRDEHRSAIEWLNLNSSEDVYFFGVELELLRIGDSLPAPNFNVVAQPSQWQKEATGGTRDGRSERQLAYHDFFVDLLDRIKSVNPGFTTASRIGYDSWLTFGVGRTGFWLSAAFSTGGFGIELNISPGSAEVNKRAYDELLSRRAEIEAAIGGELDWQRLDHAKQSRITSGREGVSVESSDEVLDEVKDWAVGELVRFREVFAPRVKVLDLTLPSPSGEPEKFDSGVVDD